MQNDNKNKHFKLLGKLNYLKEHKEYTNKLNIVEKLKSDKLS